MAVFPLSGGPTRIRAFPRELDVLLFRRSATRSQVRLSCGNECFDELARKTKARTSENDASFTVCGPRANEDPSIACSEASGESSDLPDIDRQVTKLFVCVSFDDFTKNLLRRPTRTISSHTYQTSEFEFAWRPCQSSRKMLHLIRLLENAYATIRRMYLKTLREIHGSSFRTGHLVSSPTTSRLYSRPDHIKVQPMGLEFTF
jgi:hypothetical protein